jgi:hypothetical protein
MYVQYINFCALTEVGFLVLRPREGNLMTVAMMMMLMMMTTVRQCEDRSVNMKKPSRRVTLQCARDGQNSEITLHRTGFAISVPGFTDAFFNHS